MEEWREEREIKKDTTSTKKGAPSRSNIEIMENNTLTMELQKFLLIKLPELVWTSKTSGTTTYPHQLHQSTPSIY